MAQPAQSESTMSCATTDQTSRSEETMSFANNSTLLARSERTMSFVTTDPRSERTMSYLTNDRTLTSEQAMSCASSGMSSNKKHKSSHNITVKQYDIDILNQVGNGTFGTVFRGTHKQTKETVAAKKIYYKSDTGGDDTQLVRQALTELRVFQRLSGHPNIVKLHDYVNDRSNLWLIMDFCELGDLQCYAQKYKPDFDQKLDIITQSANAICYMHSLKPPIIHRDIKPPNILLKKVGDEIVVKVADFGVSKIFSDVDKFRSQFTMNTFAGSYYFMAPEFFDTRIIEYHPSVDTYSLGLVCHVLLQHEGNGGLIPQNGVGMPIGLSMFNDVQIGRALNPICQRRDADDLKITEVKDIINNMVKFKDNDRMKLREVKKRLDDIQNTPAPTENGMASGSTTNSQRRVGGYVWQDGQKCDVTGTVGRVAKMECCGKRISTLGMRQQVNNTVVEDGFEMRCSNPECQSLWYMKDVKGISGFDDKQWDIIDAQLQINELIICGGMRKCPKCHNLCIRLNPENARVICAICENFEFCWNCALPWNGRGTVCQNSDCVDFRYQLANSDTKLIKNERAYCLRACPNCSILLWHSYAGKHVRCHRCRKRFCFVCLRKPQNGRFSCLKKTCNLAPVQMF